MAELRLGPFPLGMDNVSPETGLSPASVRDAFNCDFDAAGGISRRRGYRVDLAGTFHSLWGPSRAGASFCAGAGYLYRVRYLAGAVSLIQLGALNGDDRVSFDNLLDRVVYSNGRDIGYIVDSERLLPLGVENPAGVSLAPSTSGALFGGRYGVAISYVRNGEESGLSPISFVTVPTGGGITIAPSQPVETADTVNVYRTPANGNVLYLAEALPVGITSYLLGNTEIGRPADNRRQKRMRAGSIVRYWNGRLLVARGTRLDFSRSLHYGRTLPNREFVQESLDITLVQPVLGGVFVGTNAGVMFYQGDVPGKFTRKVTGAKPPIVNTGRSIEAAELGGLGQDLNLRGERYAFWLSQNGFVLGSDEGHVYEVQGSRIRLPESQWGGVGAMAVHDRQVIAVVN